MNRREYLAMLTAIVLGGYFATSKLFPDGSSASALFGASWTGGRGTYGVGGYGAGEYGK